MGVDLCKRDKNTVTIVVSTDQGDLLYSSIQQSGGRGVDTIKI